MRGLTVSVGQWYADLLRITLPKNMRHFQDCLIVTAPGDPAIEVARNVPNVTVSITDAFTRWGARFNKGLAIEEAGFDTMGRHGWICLHDADILLPDTLPLSRCVPSRLYGARRRIVADVGEYRSDIAWSYWPQLRDNGCIGFFQLFHASAIAHKRPWYDVTFAHAGGGDAAFIEHWRPNDRVVLPFDVLHLGPVDTNWFGCDPVGRAMMARFVGRNKWNRAIANFTPEAIADPGEVIERVDVPDYPPSTYELPFIRRTRQGHL